MEKSRSQNAKRNIIIGYIAQIGICILSFVGRKIFLNFLSIDYLGINGLYTNILTVMSLAELGVDVAVVYSLYKPVADNDIKLIHSLILYFRKIYRVLSCIIFLLGILLIPFLKYLIKSEINPTDLKLYYILFLVNTVASYFVAEKVALLSAYQEQRIQRIITLIFQFILQGLYILVLIIFKNYYVYISMSVLTTFMTTVTLGIVTERLHPEIFKEKCIVSFDKKIIKKRIKDTLLYKIGGVLINSTDNILISVLVDTAAVGFYGNYVTVVSAITAFITIITTSLISGIGNLGAKEGKTKQNDLFYMLVFIYHYIAAIGLIGFFLLFNNLIAIWVGSKFVFDSKTVFVISFNFYLLNATAPVWMFREANGLFDEVKYLLIIRAAFNLFFSILLGYYFGVFGILLATTISLLLTSFWYEPGLLYKKIFSNNVSKYWFKQIKHFISTMVSLIVSYFAIKSLSDSFIMLVVKAFIIFAITSIIFIACNFNSNEYYKLKSYIFKSKKLI